MQRPKTGFKEKKNGLEVVYMEINLKSKPGSLPFLTDISIFLPCLYFSSQFPTVVVPSLPRMCVHIYVTLQNNGSMKKYMQ